jgi:hypothetical protein
MGRGLVAVQEQHRDRGLGQDWLKAKTRPVNHCSKWIFPSS